MAVWHFTMDEVVHFIMIFWATELMVMKKHAWGGGGCEVDPDDDNGSDNDCPEESIEAVNEPVDVVVVVVDSV